MSQHPSLLGSQKGKQHRSVLKRYEKLKHLIEKEKWKEEKDSIYSLPKVKSIRFKVKKEKAAVAEGEAGAAVPGAAPAAGGAAGAQPKGGAAGVQPKGAPGAAAAGTKPGADKAAAPQKDKKAKA